MTDGVLELEELGILEKTGMRQKDRVCPKCKTNLLTNRRWCRECSNADNRARHARQKEKVNAKHREYYRSKPEEICNKQKSRRKRLGVPYRLVQIKAYCERKGIPFNLTEEDLIHGDNCPVFGIPLNRSDRNHTPSVDRLIPELGYVKGNVCVISMQANRLKNNATLEQLEQLVSYVRKHTP
jgi:hypothetical protein